MSVLREIEETVPALRRYAWALLRHDQDADDLVQDCLVRALDRLPSRMVDLPVRPWLFTIMHNLFVSRWRSLKRRGRVMTEDDGMAETAIPPTQDWRLSFRDLIGALDRLPEEQRHVLLLVGVEGLGYRETARVLDIPLGTVMSRLSRARDNLRERMEGRERPMLRRVK
jgi:RNA polymerase sigma-70 factor (ECF subfamily)